MSYDLEQLIVAMTKYHAEAVAWRDRDRAYVPDRVYSAQLQADVDEAADVLEALRDLQTRKAQTCGTCNAFKDEQRLCPMSWDNTPTDGSGFCHAWAAKDQ